MFITVLMNGLYLSSIYCLVALGLTLLLGVMDIADFAQGGLYMLGAFVTFFAAKIWGLNFLFAISLSIIATTIVGVMNNILVYQPVMRREASSLIAALGILLIIQNLALIIFGADYQTFQLPFGQERIEILRGTMTVYKSLIILTACVLVLAVWLFLHKTKIGKAIRAVSQNREGAAIVGIGGGKVSIFTFGIGTALVGLSGALVSPLYAFDAYFGTNIIVKAFAISIFGGLGSILGTILGALIIGIGENMFAAYLSTEYSDLTAFTLLILILFVRPQGLFGRKPAWV